MRCSTDHTAQTISVEPATSAEGDLSKGPLRFERVGGAMAGEPAMVVEDGVLALHYADGASIRINS